jgi:outer membrane receptor protein involved in Fe transport
MASGMTMRRIGSAALLACLWPVVSFAQNVTLEGRVTDPQGGTINGALVTLTSPEAAIGPRTTRTGVDGTFSFDVVPAGSVNVQIDAPGFERWMQAVALTATTAPLNAVLQITGVVESMGVVAPKLEEEIPQIIERGGVRAQTITATEIQNGGYYDVAQALQALVPGLFLTPKAGPFDDVTASLQGSRTNEILWLVDGVRISNRLYNGTTPLDTIPAHMVDRIEILEGGQGLFYGTQAVAGVINVVTKSFTDRTNAMLQGGGHTNDGGFVSGLARGTAQGNRFVVYGSTDDADGFQQFPGAQYQHSTTDRERSYNVHTFGGKYAYDTDDGTGSGNTITANSTDAVRVHGVSLVGSASLTNAIAASLGYTYTTPEQGNQLAGGYSSLPGLPSNRVNSSVDVHPARLPVGATLSVFWVGEIFDNVSGFGPLQNRNARGLAAARPRTHEKTIAAARPRNARGRR